MRNALIILFVVLVVGACTPTQQAARQSTVFASMYNPSEFSLNVDYKLFHLNDDLTSLYIRIFPGELLFNQANNENEYRALVRIDYAIFLLDEDGVMVEKSDSASFTIKLSREDQESSAYFSSRVLSVTEGSNYLMRIEARDLHRGTVGMRHMYINKQDDLSPQNFSILSARTGYPKFQDYVLPGELFRIQYRYPGLDLLYLDYYVTDEEFPKPPVTQTSQSYYPREVDTMIVVEYDESNLFTLPEKGTYYIRIDTLRPGGKAISQFGTDFPQVKTDEALADPLFYLTTQTEYKNLLNSENLKLAVDDFWLQRSNSVDRSRELIRVYYNRVLYSNLFFTADQEGWKTDRGMVFILFGPPDRMRDSGIEQRWYYIARRQNKVIEFVFERRPGAFSNNDLFWRKNIESMQYWSSAVSSWRAGNVYSLGK